MSNRKLPIIKKRRSSLARSIASSIASSSSSGSLTPGRVRTLTNYFNKATQVAAAAATGSSASSVATKIVAKAMKDAAVQTINRSLSRSSSRGSRMDIEKKPEVIQKPNPYVTTHSTTTTQSEYQSKGYDKKNKQRIRKLFRDWRGTSWRHKTIDGYNWVGHEKDFSAMHWYNLTYLNAKDIYECFRHQPAHTGNTPGGTFSATTLNANQTLNSPENKLYLSHAKERYTFYNPTNYEITLFIYDIVSKQTVERADNKENLLSNERNYNLLVNDQYTTNARTDPVGLMQRSLVFVDNAGKYDDESDPTADNYTIDAGFGVANTRNLFVNNANTYTNPGMQKLDDPTLRPAHCYQFNRYWGIKKKTVVRLLPTQSHIHTLNIKLGKIITKGQHASTFQGRWGSGDNAVLNAASELPIRHITHGLVVGVMGQVINKANAVSISAEANSTINKEVGTCPPKVTVKVESEYLSYYFPAVQTQFTSVYDNLNGFKNVDKKDVTVFSNLREVSIQDTNIQEDELDPLHDNNIDENAETI